MPNPFEIVSADLMPLSDVGRDLVRNHTEYAKLAAHAHTIVWGSRGSGKSIHFRFLEPLAQACASDTGTNGDVRAFVEHPDAFVGVYVNCREPKLNREEFRCVTELQNYDKNFGHLLFNRHFACVIVESLASTILEQLGWLGDAICRASKSPQWFRFAILGDECSLLTLCRRYRPKSREPRVISVSLKTDPNERLKRILNIAEREAFLHRKWYRSKRGNINLPCFVLNRRLCPHFNLDLSGFQGRLEVAADELALALSDPAAFVATVRRKGDGAEDKLGQLTLFSGSRRNAI